MKIYTGSGDRGKTSLFSGERVGKDNERVEAYGDLDELNAVLGALAAGLPEAPPEPRADLQAIQSDLLRIGAWLATTPGAAAAPLPGARPAAPPVGRRCGPHGPTRHSGAPREG